MSFIHEGNEHEWNNLFIPNPIPSYPITFYLTTQPSLPSVKASVKPPNPPITHHSSNSKPNALAPFSYPPGTTRRPYAARLPGAQRSPTHKTRQKRQFSCPPSNTVDLDRQAPMQALAFLRFRGALRQPFVTNGRFHARVWVPVGLDSYMDPGGACLATHILHEILGGVAIYRTICTV
jgi:hypothetical protein